MEKYGSGVGTSQLYVVEARNISGEPVREVNGILLTRDWRRLPTRTLPGQALVEVGSSVAVPSPRWPSIASEHGLLERGAAYALAVRFQIESNDVMGGRTALCVETRLVEVKLEYSFSITEVGVCEPLSIFESLRYLKATPREKASDLTVAERMAADAADPVRRVTTG